MCKETSMKTQQTQTELIENNDLEKCQLCGEVLYPVIENNGFSQCEGQEMFEYTGMECRNRDCRG